VGCSRKLSTGRSVIGEPGQSAFYANRFEGMVTLMPTRNVVLTDRQCVLINTLVESGRYQNASEVLREGLRLIEIREAENAARLHELRGAVQVGLDDLAEGKYREFDSTEALRVHLTEVAERALHPRKG
jgi:antitoxin ParD1/3/4